jgi:hypothetical protein
MKHNPNPNRLRLVVGALVALVAVAATAQTAEEDPDKSLTAPLYVGNLQPVRDPFGRPMRGIHRPDGGAFPSLVEIFTAPKSGGAAAPPVKPPPDLNGEPNAANELLASGGAGMNAVGDSGLFSIPFKLRLTPLTNTMYFARVYNAPTRSAATFYSDSAPVWAPVYGSSLVLAFGDARPINTNGWSSPDDPFTVSHAELLGIDDRRTDDYDNDGYSNWHEWLAGTAPDDPDSRLAFRLIRGEPSTRVSGAGEAPARAMRVKWQSVPGKKYRLEYVAQLVPDPATGLDHEIIPVEEVVTAGEGEYEIEMLVEELPEDAVTGVFRVWVVP